MNNQVNGMCFALTRSSQVSKGKESTMEDRNVVDKRSIKLEDVLKPDYIPFMAGRPRREKVIGADDIINLKITINTCNTVEDFLKMS